MQPCKAAFFNSVKVTQLCQNLCDPTDFTVCGILQARTLEWEAITFSRNFFSNGNNKNYGTTKAPHPADT